MTEMGIQVTAAMESDRKDMNQGGCGKEKHPLVQLVIALRARSGASGFHPADAGASFSLRRRIGNEDAQLLARPAEQPYAMIVQTDYFVRPHIFAGRADRFRRSLRCAAAG